MSGLSKESRSWHLGTAKIVVIWLLASILFSLFVAILTDMEGSVITSEDAEMYTLMGCFIGAVIVSVASREVRKTKACLKWECGGTMVKILATGKYVCQVCGSESDPSKSSRESLGAALHKKQQKAHDL